VNPAPAALAGEYQILTSAGPAGISVVRVRGTRAARFIKRHVRGGAAHTAWRAGDVWRAALVDEAGAPVDDIRGGAGGVRVDGGGRATDDAVAG
jgi:hypothetical protein